MIGSKNKYKYYLLFAMMTILLCSQQICANESKQNDLSISDRLFDNSSLILSYPITIANTDEIIQETSGKSRPLAENYLKSLADHGRKSRKLSGTLEIIASAVNTGFGIHHAVTADERSSVVMVGLFGSAGILLLSGIQNISSNSSEEAEYLKVASLPTLDQRQKTSIKSMQSLADKRKRERIGAGTLDIVFSLIYLGMRPIDSDEDNIINMVFGGFHFVLAAINFSTTSQAEKTLKQYNRDIKSVNPLNVQIKSNYSDELQLVLLKRF